MTTDTTSDANPVMTDGGQTQDDRFRAVYQTYEEGAEFETAPDGTIENHDELVDAGLTYREIQFFSVQTIEKFDLTVVDEDHPLWCEEVADLERGESLRVDDLRGETDD